MTYHHPEGAADATGWVSEEVLFYGADRRWRRLRMMDLGLPESTWPGGDTYGAGRLSPDGRWWATGSTAGTVLVNLASGRARVIELPGLHRVPPKWLPDSRAFITTPFAPLGKPRTFRVSVPDGGVTRVPYQYVDVGFARDGSAITLDRGARHKSVLVKWVGKKSMNMGPIDALPLRGSAAGAAVHTAGRFALFEATQENGGGYDIVVRSSSGGRVEARLRYPVDRHVGVSPLSGWVDEETLLVEVPDGLLAWRPGDQRLYRVTDLPPAEPDTYWTFSVALEGRR